ncbi:HAD family hydrolase [Campylobacter hyointestinalis]|uniref:HAD family hydrolase n=1 Tax=Campylobacter hyointestinalis TaxID=198 RepID=UPI00072501C6|nr:phosphoglycolate phosphatase [Campylobacter hyointestinalis subsp. hyointestinalis]CUU76289.1 phosphoglycolate phosphatase [Campylobacter hyointestinalis subsp. hyointestinalis]
MSRPTILFDLDGTLIDSTNSILNGFFAAFDTFKFKRPQIEEICALIGHPLDYMFAHLGVNDEAVWDFVAAYKETYKKTYLQDTKLLDFAKESIELANEFADLGVVTTKTSKYSVILLDHLGVGKYFKTVIGKDDVINPKPHPEPILKALLNLDKTDKFAYMVGYSYGRQSRKKCKCY